ncbi:Sec1 domain-containing protein 2, partial [Phlyctochytrium planicorne]
MALDLVNASRSAFEDLKRILNGAVVVYDRAFEQVIKWSCPGGFGSLLEAGAITFRNLESISAKVQDRRGVGMGSGASLYMDRVDFAGERGWGWITGDDEDVLGPHPPYPETIVFLTSTHLARHAETIRSILAPSNATSPHMFQRIRIVSAISDAAHASAIEMEPDLAAEFDAYLGFSSYFGRVESKVRSWVVDKMESMDKATNYDPVVIVEHLPLLYATLSNDLFTIPSSAEFFPSIYPREENVGGKSLDAPTSFDKDTRDLAGSFYSMFEFLNVKEEFFVLGESSKQVARCVISQSMNAPRRKSESNLAVVLIDRTHDLATPASHTDNLLDQMRNVISKDYPGSLDLTIDSTWMLEDWNDDFIARASISHGSDPDAMDLLTVLTMLGRKDGLVAVRKRLVDLIAREVPEGRPRVLGKVTLAQMEKLLGVLMFLQGVEVKKVEKKEERREGGWGWDEGEGDDLNDEKETKGGEKVLAKFGPLVQIVAAVIEACREGQFSNWDELMAVEKVISLSLAESPEASSIISPLRDVVSQGWKSVGSSAFGGSSASPSRRTSTAAASPPSSPPSIRQSMSARSNSNPSITGFPASEATVREALLLSVLGFSLLGRSGAILGGRGSFGPGEAELDVMDEDDEMLLRDALGKAAMVGVPAPVSSSTEGSARASSAGQHNLDPAHPAYAPAWRRWKTDVDLWTAQCVKVLRRLAVGMSSRGPQSDPFGGRSSNPPNQGFQSLIRKIASEAVLTPSNQPMSGGVGPGAGIQGGQGDDLLSHVPYGGTLGSVLSGF